MKILLRSLCLKGYILLLHPPPQQLKTHATRNRMEVLWNGSDSVVSFQHLKNVLRIKLPAIVDTCQPYGRSFYLLFFPPGKFEKYEIKWSKFDQKSKKWIEIFKYDVTDPERQTSVLFTMKPERDNDYFNYSRSRAKGRYRAYDKAYFGNYFAGSHVLDIERVTAADRGTYKVEVYNRVRSVGNAAIIELRHEGEKKEESTCNFFFIDTVSAL